MNPPRPAAVPPTPASHALELYGRYFQGLDTDQKLAERMAVLYRANPVERQYIDTHLAYLATQQMGRLEQLATAQLQATRQAVALLQGIAGTGTDVVDGLELVLGVLNRAPEPGPALSRPRCPKACRRSTRATTSMANSTASTPARFRDHRPRRARSSSSTPTVDSR